MPNARKQSSRNIERILIDNRKVIHQNRGKRYFIARRKAYSCVYVSLAWEYLLMRNRNLALLNILKSILIYPLKNHNSDKKYRIFCRILFPLWLYTFLSKHYRRKCDIGIIR